MKKVQIRVMGDTAAVSEMVGVLKAYESNDVYVEASQPYDNRRGNGVRVYVTMVWGNDNGERTI